MPIFINTDNSNKKRRIYIADKAGAAGAAVEEKIKEMVIKAFVKEPAFTTDKIDDPKGYTLFCEVTVFEKPSKRDTKIKIVIEIIRYPTSYTKKHGSKGEKVMTSGELSGEATGSGTDGLSQAIEAIMEKIVPKTIPVMKIDMTRR